MWYITSSGPLPTSPWPLLSCQPLRLPLVTMQLGCSFLLNLWTADLALRLLSPYLHQRKVASGVSSTRWSYKTDLTCCHTPYYLFPADLPSHHI
jgi:hypothetical protein